MKPWVSVRRTSSTYLHYTAISIYRDALPAADTLRRHTRAQHGRNVVFARDDGTVTE